MRRTLVAFVLRSDYPRPHKTSDGRRIYRPEPGLRIDLITPHCGLILQDPSPTSAVVTTFEILWHSETSQLGQSISKMDWVRRETAEALGLGEDHSKQTLSSRLVFKSPGVESQKPAAFQHFYAGSYHSSTTVETWYSETATETDLGSFSAARDAEMGAPSASLRVIVVPREGDKRSILYMGRVAFLKLFNTLALDEYALYLYRTNVPGLHFLGRRTPNADESSPVLSFYLDTEDYTFIWSYNPRTRATNAMLFGEADATWQTNRLLRAMCTKDTIIFHPLYLAFLACSRGFLGIWDSDSSFKPNPELVSVDMELDIDLPAGLVHFSQARMLYGRHLTNGERSAMELKNIQSIARQLDPTYADSLWNEAEIRDIIPSVASGGDNDDEMQRSTREIRAAIPLLQRHVVSRITYFENKIRWAKVNLRVVSRDRGHRGGRKGC